MPTWFINRAYAGCSGIRVNRPTQDKSHRFSGHQVRAVSKGSDLCRRVCAVVLRRQREGRRAGCQPASVCPRRGVTRRQSRVLPLPAPEAGAGGPHLPPTSRPGFHRRPCDVTGAEGCRQETVKEGRCSCPGPSLQLPPHPAVCIPSPSLGPDGSSLPAPVHLGWQQTQALHPPVAPLLPPPSLGL